MKYADVDIEVVMLYCPYCGEPIENSNGSHMWDYFDAVPGKIIYCDG
jgi:hypothetical protein